MEHTHQNLWTPFSWRDYPIQQQPIYSDLSSVEATEKYITTLPGVASETEIESLRTQITRAQSGEAFLVQGGDCAERFMDCREEVIHGQVALLAKMCATIEQKLQKKTIMLARIAGQYAKPRSNQVELVDGIGIPSYRGDMVNHIDPTVHARTPDPQRLMLAYKHSVKTKYIIKQYHQEMQAPLAYCSHEGLLLGYEQALVRSARDHHYATSAHMLWVGKRTARIGEAHIEFFRGIRNPIGIKIGPDSTPKDIAHMVNILNPNNESGKIILIPRFGSSFVKEYLPGFIQALAGKNVLWSCDPMHGNTFLAAGQMKTRRYQDILNEMLWSAEIHAAHGTHFGGLHFELTAQEVTECLGGRDPLSESDLQKNYKTACDPRLNAAQSTQIIEDFCSSSQINQSAALFQQPDLPVNMI